MKRKEMHKIMQTDFTGTIFEPLLQLTDCPKHMYYRGVLPKTSIKLVTVVGSRAHSAYAKQALEHIIRGLIGQHICIVSGLALGIDAQAHRLAIENNITTVAVPGSGLDETVLYPATNRGVANSILEHNGSWISEFEPTDRAAIWTFPKRNRIMAAIADLVIVVEAGEKSGTLITARNALEYNKDVAVVPGSIFNSQAVGSNDLLRHGAHIVTGANDVLDLLGLTPTAIVLKEYNDVNETELQLIELLSQPKPRDELQIQLGVDISEFSVLVSLLEIKGHIKEELGLIYKI